ncbi:MAG: hypothetical protein BGO59_16065 [Spirosoma sp. 48-14]|nr:MAG: hypothetical protein BGO59_16065 [Spirosoma sp. 48-14]
MQLARYKNFLLDKDLYFQNKKFWNDTVSRLSNADYTEWVITKFANGEDFFDGNPIFSALYERLNKAIRIIQIEKDILIPELRVWLENVQYEDRSNIKELLIVIQPSDSAFQTAQSIITTFLKGLSVKKYITTSNAFYKSKAQQARAKLVMESFEKTNQYSQPRKVIAKKSAKGELRAI